MLKESKGNMYEWVTHTWNPIKGECYHNCSYCYMKRFGRLNPTRLDEKELKTDLGKDNVIFVGSSCDIFAEDIPREWINKVLKKCYNFDNIYLFQTKNTHGFKNLFFPEQTIYCTTIETNRWYPDIMHNSPKPKERAYCMVPNNYITIEPILDFDLNELINLIKKCKPIQVNIGADSGNNNLPEPPKEKILELTLKLSKFTRVKEKKNLKKRKS
jgi:hypothetical protein